MPDLLFVYGTLRKGNSNPMALHLAHHAEYVTDGWFQGRMYQVSYYPGVVASDYDSHRVYGEVYRLEDSQLMLAVLDEYEECTTKHATPTEYQRSQTRIQTLDGGVLEPVWIYLYQWSLQGKALIESGDFMQGQLA